MRGRKGAGCRHCLSAMWPEASCSQDHSYRQLLSLWWLPYHGGLHLKTWNKMDSASLKLPVTAVGKLFPPSLQSYILGFGHNFAFHFDVEDGADLHDICLLPVDYHTLRISMTSACSPLTTKPSTLSSVLKLSVIFVQRFTNVISFTSPWDLRRSVPMF